MSISPALRGISLILPRVKYGAGLLRRTAKYAFRAGSPTRRRGKKSLLIRRDATLRIACLNGR